MSHKRAMDLLKRLYETDRSAGFGAGGDVEPPPVRVASDPSADRPLFVCLGLGLVVAASAGTQYVAWRLGFHPNLGWLLVVLSPHVVRLCRVACALAALGALAAVRAPRWRRLAGPLLLLGLLAGLGSMRLLYAPHAVFVWYAATERVPAAAPLFHTAWVLIGAVGVAWSVVVTTTWRSWRSGRGEPARSHGSAHWGSGQGLHGKTGLLLGRDGRRLLRFPGQGHILTMAPTRSGKGMSAVIPNLLDHPGSVLVTDPKGENYTVTAGWRRERGQAVHAFDPFQIVGGDATYNPLDLIDVADPGAVDDATLLADMLVLADGRGADQGFWNEEARALLTGLILHVAACAPPQLRSLGAVRTLLTWPPDRFAELLAEMGESDAVGGLVARAAARLRQKAPEERSGVISTAQSHTHFLDSMRMAHHLGRSTVDLATLKGGATSVYLMLPTDRLDAYARWLRLMIACSLLAMARTRGQPTHRVLFLLDEFAHLGRMHPVERDIGLAGGFGVTFWLIVQDLSQLRSTYGDTWLTFLANVDVLQAFGINDWETAEYLSKMTGEATIRVESHQHSEGLSHGARAHRQQGTARSVAEHGRRLLLPDEVRRLPREAELLFVKGGAPLLVERLNYLENREFVGRGEPNPLYEPVVRSTG